MNLWNTHCLNHQVSFLPTSSFSTLASCFQDTYKSPESLTTAKYARKDISVHVSAETALAHLNLLR